MKKYIIDASVVLKSILKENDSVSKTFEKLLAQAGENKVQVISLRLMLSEIANGIRFGEKDLRLSQQYLRAILNLPIKYLNISRTQYTKILDLSYELGTTVYDTSYHVLAKSQNAIFLTCDEKYYSKAKILGDIELIK